MVAQNQTSAIAAVAAVSDNQQCAAVPAAAPAGVVLLACRQMCHRCVALHRPLKLHCGVQHLFS